jgi:regulatory protein
MTKDEARGAAGDARRGRKRPRVPRKVTRASLENAALAYLGRFATTAKGLTEVLMRRVHRAAHHHGTDPAEGRALVDTIVLRYREAGLIDDATFAQARARALFARGVAVRAIVFRLRRKGVSDDDIAAAIAGLDPESGDSTDTRALDRAAARALARRRRLGPWRRGLAGEDARVRDLAALARAGFSYGIAREVIDAAADDEGTEEA